jgi:sarcosine oxidase
VVGAGIVGLSTARALIDRGVSVAVYERGLPGNGQSGGDSRIFRHAHTDPRLVRFACRSRAVWREWEARCGRELVSSEGVISLGPEIVRRRRLMADGGARAELVAGSALPGYLPILAPWDGEALLDPDGGVIRTRAAVEELVDTVGDRLIADEVLAVAPTRAGTVELRAGGSATEYDRVIVCAGRGTAALARGAGLEVPVRVLAHVRLAFAVRGEAPERLACLLDGSGAFGETGAYADPLPGNRVYAVGVDETPAHAAGGVQAAGGLAAIAERSVRYVAGALPGLDPAPVQARHCWITELPWGHDAFAVWSAGPAAFLVGHNLFKHAPALGQALAAHALGEDPGITLDPADRLGDPSAA